MATTFYGVDMFDGWSTVNFATMKSALGADGFCLIKAAGFESDNELATQPTLTEYQNGARAQSLLIGYWFIVASGPGGAAGSYTDIDPGTAADYFYDAVSIANGELMILDFDLAPDTTYSDAMDAWCYDFLTELSFRFSGAITPIMYTSYSLANQSAGSWANTASIAKLWVADYSFGATDWSQLVIPWESQTPNYLLHQYTDSGTGPTYGTSKLLVDLDTFYSPNNSQTDFTSLGYRHTTFGSLTYGVNVSPTITFTQPELQTISVPTNSYDKVVYSNTISTTITTSGGTYLVGPYNTGLTSIGEGAYPIGNFSVDGVTYADFGFLFSDDWGSYYGYLPLWTCQPQTNTNGELYFSISYSPGGTATTNITINIAILAGPALNSISSSSLSLGQITSFSNVIPSAPTPYATYRRINYNGFNNTSGYSTYAHGLGTIPNLIFWQQPAAGGLVTAPSTWHSNTSSSHSQTNLGVAMDSTYVYFYLDYPTSNEIYYRIYKDN